MGKLIVFVLVLIGISFYPIFEVSNLKIQNTTSQKKVIPTAIFDGNYSFYNPVLEKDGKFKELDIYSKKFLKAFDLWINDYLKKEKIFGSEFVLRKEVLIGKNINFFTNEYNLSTAKGSYFLDTKILKGGEFVISSDKFFGRGERFLVDKDKNVKADKIIYYLKVNQ